MAVRLAVRHDDPDAAARLGCIQQDLVAERSAGDAWRFPRSLPSVRLHENEFTIDVDLVRELLGTQMPDFAELSLTRFESSGTVNAIYRLGEGLVVRLPRAPQFGGGPEREARWMPVFARSLPIHVPTYRRLGSPTPHYPSHWSVLEWIDGSPADALSLVSLGDAATQLGEFVVALREVSTVGAPSGGNYRAFGLSNVDSDFRNRTVELPDDIDRHAVSAVWESCVAVGDWGGPASWVHTDLRGDNLIAHNGRLVAVIDWEGCTVGDPSADLLAAWWLFAGDSRETFRVVSSADKDTWFRAMGWALLMSVAAIPYYADTNPSFATRARWALDEILTDYRDHA